MIASGNECSCPNMPFNHGKKSAAMCSSASAALIMTSGTPLPGRVEAPTKYSPLISPSRIDGRKTASWSSACDRPKTAPCSTP